MPELREGQSIEELLDARRAWRNKYLVFREPDDEDDRKETTE